MRAFSLPLLTLSLTACAAAGLGSGTTPTQSGGDVASADPGWSVTTREHVDLWLHGFALLTSDTARIPYFQRGYKQRLTALKRQQNVYTTLDANATQLSARFAANPSLSNAQFAVMYFPSFQDIVTATGYFIQAEGNPRASQDPAIQNAIALLAAHFPSPADRDWLRLFVAGLQDESNRFYHGYWTAEQQSRSPIRGAIEGRWRGEYHAKFRRYLSNTQQAAGELMLSLPLDGEGRTVSDGKRANAIAVAFPETQANALDAIYVFAHEAINKVTETAIADNTTPAEQRAGLTARYSASATVWGGAELLRRVAPELVSGYMRYYLRSAGLNPPTDPTAQFTATFALPAPIKDAITRQLEVVLGGI